MQGPMLYSRVYDETAVKEGGMKEELILEDYGDPNEFTEYKPLKESGGNEATREDPSMQVSALPSSGTGGPFETVICGSSDNKIKQEIFEDESDVFRSFHEVEHKRNWGPPAITAEPYPTELPQCILPENFISPNVLSRTTSKVRSTQNRSSKQMSTRPKLMSSKKLLEAAPDLGFRKCQICVNEIFTSPSDLMEHCILKHSGTSLSFPPATATVPSNEYIGGHFSQQPFCTVETLGLCETITVAGTSSCSATTTAGNSVETTPGHRAATTSGYRAETTPGYRAATTAGYSAETTPYLNVSNTSNQPPHWVPPYISACDVFDGIFVSLRNIPVESRKATRDKILELVKFISLENVNPALVNFSVIK